MEIFARGVRNTVGFDWHPTTRELWFTDNGRDNLGNDAPGDELNRVPKAGMHFGYPFCHEGKIADPEFGAKRSCSGVRTAGTAACAARGRRRHALLHGIAVPASSIAIRSSSRSTARGTAARAMPFNGNRISRRPPARQQGGQLRAVRRRVARQSRSGGVVLRISKCCRMDRCWCRTTWQE